MQNLGYDNVVWKGRGDAPRCSSERSNYVIRICKGSIGTHAGAIFADCTVHARHPWGGLCIQARL